MNKKGIVLLLVLSFLFTGILKGGTELPIYGNWCGPGHPADLEGRLARKDSLPLPINGIDELCKYHDFAYLGKKPWPEGGSSEADNRLSFEVAKILNMGETWRYSPEPNDYDTDPSKFKRWGGKLTDEEFLMAVAISNVMNSQKYVTIGFDIVEGNWLGVAKVITSPTLIVSAATPSALLDKCLDSVSISSENLRAGKDPIELAKGTLIKLCVSYKLKIWILLETEDLKNKSFDNVLDFAEATVSVTKDVSKDALKAAEDIKKNIAKAAKKAADEATKKAERLAEKAGEVAGDLAVEEAKKAAKRFTDISDRAQNRVGKIVVINYGQDFNFGLKDPIPIKTTVPVDTGSGNPDVIGPATSDPVSEVRNRAKKEADRIRGWLKK